MPPLAFPAKVAVVKFPHDLMSSIGSQIFNQHSEILDGIAKFRAWSVSPQGVTCSLLSANQGFLLHRMTRKYRVWDGCSEFAWNLLGICLEFARNSEFARNLLGIHSENGSDQPCAELCRRDIPRKSGQISGWTSRPKNFHPIARNAGK